MAISNIYKVSVVGNETPHYFTDLDCCVDSFRTTYATRRSVSVWLERLNTWAWQVINRTTGEVLGTIEQLHDFKVLSHAVHLAETKPTGASTPLTTS